MDLVPPYILGLLFGLLIGVQIGCLVGYGFGKRVVHARAHSTRQATPNATLPHARRLIPSLGLLTQILQGVGDALVRVRVRLVDLAQRP